MNAPKEIRNWFNRMRRKYGGKNGVVSFLDNPEMERKWSKSDTVRSRYYERRLIENRFLATISIMASPVAAKR
jgi:hypothetical protein